MSNKNMIYLLDVVDSMLTITICGMLMIVFMPYVIYWQLDTALIGTALFCMLAGLILAVNIYMKATKVRRISRLKDPIMEATLLNNVALADEGMNTEMFSKRREVKFNVKGEQL